MSRRFMDWQGDDTAAAYYLHETGGEIAVEMVQDLDPVFARTHAIREHLNPHSADKSLRMDAVIPAVVIEIWRKEYGVDFYQMNDPDQQRWIDKMLSSNEWYKLRTSKGTLA